MKGKLTKIILSCVIVVLAGTSVFAVTSTDILSKLDSIKVDINGMKQEYEIALATYSSVLNSLSAKNKQTLEELTNNLMADDVKSKLKAAKAELEMLSIKDADKVLAAINDVQDKARRFVRRK